VAASQRRSCLAAQCRIILASYFSINLIKTTSSNKAARKRRGGGISSTRVAAHRGHHNAASAAFIALRIITRLA